jgi:hypothetical protein
MENGMSIKSFKTWLKEDGEGALPANNTSSVPVGKEVVVSKKQQKKYVNGNNSLNMGSRKIKPI